MKARYLAPLALLGTLAMPTTANALKIIGGTGSLTTHQLDPAIAEIVQADIRELLDSKTRGICKMPDDLTDVNDLKDMRTYTNCTQYLENTLSSGETAYYIFHDAADAVNNCYMHRWDFHQDVIKYANSTHDDTCENPTENTSRGTDALEAIQWEIAQQTAVLQQECVMNFVDATLPQAVEARIIPK